MSVSRYILFFFLCILCIFSCQQEKEDTNIPIESFFKNPETTAFKISPNGKYLSFLKYDKDKLNLFIQNTSGDSTVQITSFEEESIEEYYWAGSSHLVLLVKNTVSGNLQLFTINRKTKTSTRIPFKSSVTKLEFIGSFKYPDRYVLFSMNERNPENMDVYKLDVLTAESKMIDKNPGNFLRWITDDKNAVRLAIGTDGIKEILYYRETNNANFKAIKTCNFKSTLIPLGFNSDKAHHIYALSNLDRDKLALVEVDCLTGKETRVLYENPKADIYNTSYSKTLNKISYVNTALHKREAHFLEPRAEEVYKKIKKNLKNEVIELVDLDSAENLYLLYAYTDKSPGVYYLYNISRDELSKLGETNSSIKKEEMSEMQSIQFKNREGLTIYGYLTRPKDKKKAKNLPLVVMPHDGPYKRDLWGFNPDVQFLASRGYAVLQVNFRGSVGYGKEFYTSGFGEWRNNIQNDITDGVKWLIKENIADSTKIAIYGHGFGGFSALNQVILNPDLYTCAISYSGYINLFSYVKGIPAYYKPYKEVLYVMIGNPEKDVEYMKQASPIFQTANIKVPLMIFQGGRDHKVNMRETNQFIKELRKNKQKVVYILNENEAHTISNTDAKIHFYKSLEVFLNKHMANK